LSPSDLVFYPPLCLAICLVWAGTRETTVGGVVKHTLLLSIKVTVGLALLGIGLQAALWLFG